MEMSGFKMRIKGNRILTAVSDKDNAPEGRGPIAVGSVLTPFAPKCVANVLMMKAD